MVVGVVLLASFVGVVSALWALVVAKLGALAAIGIYFLSAWGTIFALLLSAALKAMLVSAAGVRPDRRRVDLPVAFERRAQAVA
ncbi:MAG: hypothetical protein AAF865_16700 [Pseudomonadota bacterium]